MMLDWYKGQDDLAPSWMGTLHDTSTIILPRDRFEGEFVAKKNGISIYMLTKEIGPFPVGYLVGEKP